MERNDAIIKLKQLENVDLVALAHKYDVTIWKGDKKTRDGQGMSLNVILGVIVQHRRLVRFVFCEI